MEVIVFLFSCRLCLGGSCSCYRAACAMLFERKTVGYIKNEKKNFKTSIVKFCAMLFVLFHSK